MINILILLRAVVDLFWELKLLSILFAIVVVSAILLALYKRIKKRGVKHKASILDALVLLLYLSVTLSYFINIELETTILYGKIAIGMTGYLIARLSPMSYPVKSKLLMVGAYLLLAYLLAISFMDIGYKTWGNAYTFVGGYFFKTDLAIAVTVAFSICYFATRNNMLKLLVFSICLYLIYISNSRVFLLVVLMAPAVDFYIKKSSKLDIARSLRLGLAIILPAIIALYIFDSLSDSEMLGFKISEGYTDRNLQGRNMLWEILFLTFQHYPVVQKLLGGGLDSDTISLLAYSQDGYGAHNTFLYILISCGLLGISLVSAVLYFGVKHALRIAAYDLGFCKFCLFIIVAWMISGLSNDTIKYLQFSFFFWVVLALAENKYQEIKLAIRHAK